MGPVLENNQPVAANVASAATSSSSTGAPSVALSSQASESGLAIQSGEVVQALPPPPPPAPAKPKEEPKAAATPAKADSKGTGTAAKGKEAAATSPAKGKDAGTTTAGKGKAAATDGKAGGKDAKPGTGKDAKAASGKDAKSTGTTAGKGKADPKAKEDPKAAKGKDAKASDAKDVKDSTGSKKGAAAQERYWLQVATGADTKALGFDLKRIKSKYSFLAPYGGYTSPFRGAKRLVIGPFKSVAEAKAAESKANKAGLSSFVWISPAGMDVDPLGGK